MAAFGGARGAPSRPPEKGIFPLDHFGECKQVARAYLECLRRADADAAACRALSRRYLECRMERDLMAKQDLGELGLEDAAGAAAAAAAAAADNAGGSGGSGSGGIKSGGG